MDDKIATRHSDLRLMQRAREFDKSMTEVWQDSIPCDVKHHGYDEARVSPEHESVLLMQDGKIITILDSPQLELSIDNDYLEEYLERSMDV